MGISLQRSELLAWWASKTEASRWPLPSPSFFVYHTLSCNLVPVVCVCVCVCVCVKLLPPVRRSKRAACAGSLQPIGGHFFYPIKRTDAVSRFDAVTSYP